MQQSDKAGILSRSLIFSSLSSGELDEIALMARERSFVPDEAIFWEGDTPDSFYIVAEGQVKVLKHSSAGKEFIIAFFSPGEIFGEVAVFEDRPYPASAQAVVETKVLSISRKDFLEFLANRPQVALRIINVLGGRLRDAQNRLSDIAGERVEQRIAGVMLMLSTKFGFTLPFTRQEIADMTGTTIETAIRVLSSFRERKIIRSARSKIIIIDNEKLRLLSEGPPQV